MTYLQFVTLVLHVALIYIAIIIWIAVAPDNWGYIIASFYITAQVTNYFADMR